MVFMKRKWNLSGNTSTKSPLIRSCLEQYIKQTQKALLRLGDIEYNPEDNKLSIQLSLKPQTYI